MRVTVYYLHFCHSNGLVKITSNQNTCFGVCSTSNLMTVLIRKTSTTWRNKPDRDGCKMDNEGFGKNWAL